LTGVYWYVSRQKVDALLHEFGPRGFNVFKELSLTLKAPFVQAKTSSSPDRRIENGIKSAGAASDLAEAGSNPFFSFSEGPRCPHAEAPRRCRPSGHQPPRLVGVETVRFLGGPAGPTRSVHRRHSGYQ
jgi:hypothetical protein